MYKNKILCTLMCLSNLLYCQSTFYLQFKDFGCKNNIQDVILLKDENFLIALNRDECFKNDKSSSEIIKLSTNGQIVDSRIINKNPDIQENIFEIFELDNSYFVYAQQNNLIDSIILLKFYHLDLNFQIINQYEYLPDSNVPIAAAKAYFDKKHQKIFFGFFNQNIDAYIGTIQVDCQNFKISSQLDKNKVGFILELSGMVDDENYLMANYGDVFVVDSNLNIIKTLPNTNDNNNGNIRSYKNNDYIMFAEESEGYPPLLGAPISNDLTCKRLSKDWQVKKYRTLGKPLGVQDTIDSAGFKGLDWKDANKIYVAWTTFKDYTPIAEPIKEEDSWIGVAQLDSNLVPKWNRYFFGKDYHYLWGVVATNDNGVLLYGEEKSKDSLFANGFVLKLSEQGLLADESPIVDNIHITVGPNPFRSQVTFAIGSPNDGDFDLFLFDIHGRVIKKEKLYNGLNTMELSQLPNAAYFYSVLSDGKKIKQGKLIKVD